MNYFHHSFSRDSLDHQETFLVVFLGYREFLREELNSFFSYYVDRNNLEKNIVAAFVSAWGNYLRHGLILVKSSFAVSI